MTSLAVIVPPSSGRQGLPGNRLTMYCSPFNDLADHTDVKHDWKLLESVGLLDKQMAKQGKEAVQ